ncbi:hypothetical protein GCM10023350_38170 [Nocardioides endophyticus]|uniref:Glycoside hydrolase family 5 domain-containing protein n=1 Tax=Nocardioides endophyticus TaxID=1353775 RepID=A0ABP8Z877_9ACTN
MKRAWDHFYAGTRGIQTHLVRTWARLAGDVARNPAVAGYDLLNEPGLGSNSGAETAALGRFYGRKDRNIVFAPHIYAEGISPNTIEGGFVSEAATAERLGVVELEAGVRRPPCHPPPGRAARPDLAQPDPLQLPVRQACVGSRAGVRRGALPPAGPRRSRQDQAAGVRRARRNLRPRGEARPRGRPVLAAGLRAEGLECQEGPGPGDRRAPASAPARQRHPPRVRPGSVPAPRGVTGRN